MPATPREQIRPPGALGATYGILPGSCKFGIHRAIVAHRFSLVPGPSQYLLGYVIEGSTYEFDCDLLVIQQICALEYDTK